MNERILEIAKQCGYWSGQTIEMNDVGIEKFAELIVRECAKWMSDGNIPDGFYEAGRMLEHFGVQE